jgi:hypothetical protein
MRRLLLQLVPGFLVITLTASAVFAQQSAARRTLAVPKLDSTAVITLDGVMNEAAWANAAQINLVTSSGYDMWGFWYYRSDAIEPDYDEYYARLLWKKDTLFAFIHIDEVVNDSSGLYWNGQWTGDQLFVSLSNRLGVNMKGWYDGNVYAAPNGPYHFLIMGNDVTLNNHNSTYIPSEYRGNCPDDTTRVFDAANVARWGITIDTVTGVWNLEMAIYHPNVNAQGSIGFNIGGSQGSRQADEVHGDAYGYYTWQPNVPDQPFTVPPVPLPSWGNDPGYFNLANADYWAVLTFTGGPNDVVRKSLTVPKLDSTAVITLDGVMNEAAWANAAQINLVTSSGYDMWGFWYYRSDAIEPDYDEYYARLLWKKDTLFAFIHIDEVVNDSSGLYWNGQWTGDQLFVSLSNRLGVNMKGWYDGNVYAAPNGPYHFLIMGNDVTLNNHNSTYIPSEYRGNCPDDTTRVFDAANVARWGITIDTVTGVWNLEMAIYHPNVNAQGSIGFNIGGSQGSRQADEVHGDAYGYYTWQPNVPDQPFTVPPVPLPSWGNDPGYFNLANADYWAVLNLSPNTTVDVRDGDRGNARPQDFVLSQNYPNPFNPETRIQYSLPKTTAVELAIYNVLGQKVVTLADGVRSAGKYEVRWDGGNLSSGIYFYQLKADGQTVAVRKMMLLK